MGEQRGAVWPFVRRQEVEIVGDLGSGVIRMMIRPTKRTSRRH